VSPHPAAERATAKHPWASWIARYASTWFSASMVAASWQSNSTEWLSACDRIASRVARGATDAAAIAIVMTMAVSALTAGGNTTTGWLLAGPVLAAARRGSQSRNDSRSFNLASLTMCFQCARDHDRTHTCASQRSVSTRSSV